MSEATTPEWQRRLAAKEAGELFRYKFRGATLVYSLRLSAEGQIEVMKVTERPVQQPVTAKLGTFAEVPQAEAELKKTRRMLESDGWKEISS
jgi:hypothetical protein